MVAAAPAGGATNIAVLNGGPEQTAFGIVRVGLASKANAGEADQISAIHI